MAATTTELKQMMGEHEGIRAHLKFLQHSLVDLEKHPMQVRDRIWTYRWGLWDFRAAVKQHIKLDERVYETLKSDAVVKETEGEHEEILKQLDDIIRIADCAVDEDHTPADMKQHAIEIKEMFEKISLLIESHTSKEDRMWQYLGQKIK